ncbi:MAG: glycine oxidase ThiO [Candidatus Dormibacterales bacterium]
MSLDGRVVVIGGGVIGCAAALALARKGAKVTLLERDAIAAGASRAAAGMLAPLSESEEPGCMASAGLEALALHKRSAQALEEIAGISIGATLAGTFMLARDEKQAEALRRRLEWQRELDRSIALLEGDELNRALPGLGEGFLAGLHYPAEMQVDARSYTIALARAAAAAGAELAQGTPVIALRRSGDRVIAVETPEAVINADRFLVATGHDASLLNSLGVALPLQPVKGDLLRLRPPRVVTRSIIFAPGGYLTPKADGTLLVGATEQPGRYDHVVEASSVAQLREFAFSVLPSLRQARFVAVQSGLRPALPDRLPAIGPIPGFEGLFVAVGHYRNGILLAGWTAERLARAMLDGEDCIPAGFLPARMLGT